MSALEFLFDLTFDVAIETAAPQLHHALGMALERDQPLPVDPKEFGKCGLGDDRHPVPPSLASLAAE